jgi:S1-C subfamily serine protease
VVLGSSAASTQALSTLHITATLSDATGKATPVARHALLISDEPPTREPRRILTALTGTVDVSLRPGHYVVESDQPVVFQGKSYEWSQRLEIVAGRDATLALTIENASAGAAAAPATSATTPSTTDTSVLASQSQESVVALWTPTQHASGFVVDARGLIVTNQRVIGTATSAEAQFAPDIRVKATVLATDPVRDIAILQVNPSVITSPPLQLACGQTRPTVSNRQELSAMGADITGQKRLTLGDVTGVGPRLILADMRLGRASSGGPVFSAGGLIGLTTVDDRDPDSRSEVRVVRIDLACEVMASAEKKIAEAMPPDATHLAMDPPPVAVGALGEAIKNRAGSLSPYSMSTTNFEVAFITPVHLYGAKDQVRRPEMDFGNWSEYLADYPRALLVRVTPKMAEGLWAKVARGAAMTQGASLPPMTRAKASFMRMRAFCGETEVTPIHPFMVEHRTSETEAIYEGLYVFDPASLGLPCGTVKLTVYSEKEPDKGDARVVDQKILQQITRDFAPL